MSGDLVKLTYYGYEQPGQPDYDSNSYNGIGDQGFIDRGGKTMTPGFSAALSVSQRKALFPGSDSSTSTGQTFTYQGKTYRDDDTSPQPFRNIDVYSPGGVPGTTGYDATRTTPLGSGGSSGIAQTLGGPSLSSNHPSLYSSTASQATESPAGDTTPSQPQSSKPSTGNPLVEAFKQKYPEFHWVDGSSILEHVRQSIAPHMGQDQFNELTQQADAWKQLSQAKQKADTSYAGSFDVLKQFYESGQSSGGSGSESES